MDDLCTSKHYESILSNDHLQSNRSVWVLLFGYRSARLARPPAGFCAADATTAPEARLQTQLPKALPSKAPA
jgi:hypothetical protein